MAPVTYVNHVYQRNYVQRDFTVKAIARRSLEIVSGDPIAQTRRRERRDSRKVSWDKDATKVEQRRASAHTLCDAPEKR